MKKTTLVIMAAGMGSRFGGPKQITPVGPSGEKIIDYSVFDAKRAGFDEVVFILNKNIKNDFIECFGENIEKQISVKYVLQDLENIPNGFSVPDGRTKPWGTGHAVLSAKDAIDSPFMVINADDYYGRECFSVLHDFLCNIDQNSEKLQLSMAGYKLGNTITESGSVSRGICLSDENGYLTSITERTKIYKTGDKIAFTEDDGKTFEDLSFDSIASLNCWAFDNRILSEFETQFVEFLSQEHPNPLKSEFFLPTVVDNLVKNDKATVKVLSTNDKWYGMTYSEDRDTVIKAINDMVREGIYPQNLWNK